MADVTYKCPSCGAYLVFDPDTQKWKCNFCAAEFDEATLLKQAEQKREDAQKNPGQAEPTADGGTQVVYHCPSCGSQIITDETTVATNCYYCHNPVVLEGKMPAEYRPQEVLPFTISKDKAVETFMSWARSKKFVPKGFFSENQIEQMQGVYYPHFVTECDMDARYDGEGRQVSVADTPREIVTSTRHYAVSRRADLQFHNVMRPALKSTNRKLSDGIHPFPLEELKPFSGAYLTGFLAERRDLSEQEATADVEKELQGYVEPLLTQTVHYNSCNGTGTGTVTRKKSRYVLLPTWVLTYKGGADKEPYYYAMNGRTGEVCGKLPINSAKLNLYGLGIAGIVFAIGCLLSYFLF